MKNILKLKIGMPILAMFLLLISPRGEGSNGCGRPVGTTGTIHLQTTDGKGTLRDYQVMIPSSYDGKAPLAVTFMYHGSGGTAVGAAGFGLQTAKGATNGSIFVFPQGIAFENYGIGWNDSCAGYDMVFFDNMLSYLKSNYCVDEKKVFAAGFSWGCDHVTALACCRGGQIRAVAAASCSDEFSNKADFKTYQNLPCPAAGTTAIRFTHDTNDDGDYSKQEFSTTSGLYQFLNSCAKPVSSAMVDKCQSFSGCKAPVLDCSYPGLGHTVPENWPTETWGFFSSFK